MEQIKLRNEISNDNKWDLTKIFKNEKEFNEFYNNTKKLIEKYKKYKNHVMDNANTFYEALTNDLEISRRLEKMYSYAMLISDEDTSINKNQERLSSVINLYDLASKSTYFFTVELLKKDKKTIEKFYKEEPRLLDYKKYIEDIYKYKKYTLSDEVEKCLSSIGKAFGNDETTYSYLIDSDMRFPNIKNEDNKDIELTDTNYSIFIKSKDRRVRKEAFEKLYQTYKQFKNTIASFLNGHINEKVSLTRLRGYKSSFEASLYHDDLSVDVYNALKDTVHDNLDVYRKYFKLKKDILKLDEMHMYDIYLELIDNTSIKKYPFDKAKELILEVSKELGNEYYEDIKKAFTEKWIDIYPNKYKRGGAYSGGCYDTNPYILLNYQEKIDDVSALIHELGHSMHSYYSRKNQPYQYGDYSIFVAEVASTTNELLLANYLIKNSKDDYEKLASLNHLLELFKATIFRQTMFEEFERKAYDLIENDDVISADKLCDIYLDLNKLYFKDSVIVDEDIKYEWEKVPHFYYNFYVYKYATSLSAACNIVKRILNKEDHALENYLKMLKSGSSLNPLDTLKLAGVDMTKKEVYQDAIDMFNDTIDEFIKISKRIKK